MGPNPESQRYGSFSLLPPSRARVPSEGTAGAIVNIGSISAIVGLPEQPAYCASKGAVLQLSRQIAADYAPYGIRCNVVGPGSIAGEFLDSYLSGQADPAAAKTAILSAHPVGRFASPTRSSPRCFPSFGGGVVYNRGQLAGRRGVHRHLTHEPTPVPLIPNGSFPAPRPADGRSAFAAASPSRGRNIGRQPSGRSFVDGQDFYTDVDGPTVRPTSLSKTRWEVEQHRLQSDRDSGTVRAVTQPRCGPSWQTRASNCPAPIPGSRTRTRRTRRSPRSPSWGHRRVHLRAAG